MAAGQPDFYGGASGRRKDGTRPVLCTSGGDGGCTGGVLHAGDDGFGTGRAHGTGGEFGRSAAYPSGQALAGGGGGCAPYGGTDEVHVDDTPYINVDQLCVIAKSLRAKGLLGLLIVDYLQLLATVNPGRTREQEVAECSRKLKGLARSLGCPVIVSSQLNRQAEDRAGSPELRHLRESGAIEQDADLVILLHRPERYHIRVDPDTGWSTRGMGIATVAKHRNGATGKVYYGYNPSMTKIGEFAGTPVTAPANNLKRKEDERKSSDLFGGSAG